MREIRTSGSEGGGGPDAGPLPTSIKALRRGVSQCAGENARALLLQRIEAIERELAALKTLINSQ